MQLKTQSFEGFDYQENKIYKDEARISQSKNSEISVHSRLESWGKSGAGSLQYIDIVKNKKLSRKKSSDASKQITQKFENKQQNQRNSAFRTSKNLNQSAQQKSSEDEKQSNLRNRLRIKSISNNSKIQLNNYDEKINIINSSDQNKEHSQNNNKTQKSQELLQDNLSKKSRSNSIKKSRSQSGPVSNEKQSSGSENALKMENQFEIQNQITTQIGIQKQHQSFNNEDLKKFLNNETDFFQYPINHNQNYFQQLNDYTTQYAYQKRQARLQQQSKLYSQNLGKIADIKRKMHSRSQRLEIKNLPPDKNFLKKNINQISNIQINKVVQTQAKDENSSKIQNLNVENSKKYERLKKLKEKSMNLTSQMSQIQNTNQHENTFHSFINDYSKQEQKQQFLDSKVIKNKKDNQNLFMSKSPILSAQFSQSQFDSNIEDFQKSQTQNYQEESGILKSYYNNQEDQIDIKNGQIVQNKNEIKKQQSKLQLKETKILLPPITGSPQSSQMIINLQLNQTDSLEKIMIQQDEQQNQKQNGKLQLPQFSFRNKSGHVDRKQQNKKQLMNRQKSVALSKDFFTNTTDAGGDLNKISQESVQFKKFQDNRQNQELSNKDNYSGSMNQQNQKFQKQILKPVSGYQIHNRITSFNRNIQKKIADKSLLKRRPSLMSSGQNKKLLNQSQIQKFTGRKSSAIVSQRRKQSKENTNEKISNSSSQQMLFMHGLNITSFYNNNSKIVKAPLMSSFQKNEQQNSILMNPVFDAKGNFAYEPKHRKPKWVLPQEFERFKKFEDHSLIKDSSRNDYIRIENPFERQPDNNKIFDHIRSDEIGKYMNGVSYLEKLKLSRISFFQTLPQLLNLKLVYSEFLVTYQLQKAFSTIQINKSLYQNFLSQIYFTPLKNQQKNLKNQNSYVKNYKNEKIYKEFNRSLRRCRLPQEIKKFIKITCFEELSYEWFDIFDPTYTQKQYEIYGEQVPEYFINQNEEMIQMHNILNNRIQIENYQLDFGEQVQEQIDKYKQNIILVQKPINKQSQDSKDKLNLEYIFKDLNQYNQIDNMQIPFNPIKKLKNKEIAEKYNNYFKVKEQNQFGKDQMQQKIVKEFDQIDILIDQFDLLENSSYRKQSDQFDFQSRKTLEKNAYEAKKMEVKKILNSEIYIQKQRSKMEMRLTKINKMTLKERGILALYKHKNPHPQIYYSIWINNFNFKQQNEFYFQWYSQHQQEKSIKKPNEFNGFYKITGYIETKENKWIEFQQKKQIYYKDNNSFQDYIQLIHRIFKSNQTNIFDNDEILLRNSEQVKQNLQYIVQFSPKNKNFDKNQNEIEVKKLLVMMQIDLNQQLNFVEPFPLNIELKFNNLVFINQYSQPIYHEHLGIFTFEYFEICYPISQHFNQNENLNESLSQVLKERLKVQIRLAQKIILKEDKLNKQIIQKWNEDKIILQQEYNQNKGKKQIKRKRRNSFTEKSDLEIDQELKQLHKIIEFQEQFPFTTDITIQRNENLELDLQDQEVFQEPKIPMIQAYEPKNIEALIFFNNNTNSTFDSIANFFECWQSKVEEFQNKLQNFNYSNLITQNDQILQNSENSLCNYQLWIDQYNNLEKNQFKIQDQFIVEKQQKNIKLFIDMTKTFEKQKYKLQLKQKSGENQSEQKKIFFEFHNKAQEKMQIYFPMFAIFQKIQFQNEILNITKMNGELPQQQFEEETILSQQQESEIIEVQQRNIIEKPIIIRKVRELQLSNSDKVGQYIDKQLRKEIEDAVLQGNVKLLKNFSQQFQKCFEERSDTKLNFKNSKGQTILHQALLMNYDKESGSIQQLQSQEDQQSNLVKKEDKLEEALSLLKSKFQKLVVNQPQYKKDLSNETEKSLNIKKQIVEILIKKMNADPSIKDHNGLTSIEIAKYLKNSDDMLQILQNQ